MRFTRAAPPYKSVFREKDAKNASLFRQACTVSYADFCTGK
jgi:hypothetical protein